MMTKTPPRKDSYIPVRPGDLFKALAGAEGLGGAEASFHEAMRLVAAIFHYEAFAALEKLKDLYFPLDPDRPGEAADSGALAPFEEALTGVLTTANFVETPFEALGRDARADALSELKLKTSDAGIRRVRYFSRGATEQKFARRRLLGLSKLEVESEVLHDVVLMVAFDTQPHKRTPQGAVPGAVLLKHFRNVARHELAALHPGAKPTMKRSDQVFLGLPALAGGAPLLLQLGAAIPVIFTVIAAYLGAKGAIDNDSVKKALAAVSGIVALGGFMMRQWVKYERQSLKYQKKLSDTVYFRNAANNTGVLYALVAAAEEQDVKEAALAYHALLKHGAMDKAALDASCEAFLREQMNFAVDFEIHDALGKLQRLNLVSQEGDKFIAAPPEEALKRLDTAWDNIFQYAAKG
ncbi:MAG TPA: DUF3754 domain-containing protein [Caulobacterales bacterium]|nr:DUF3754 domain-containing protein [Caulobacterales bacterium]